MPITMKKALIAIKKHLDEFPEALDAPIFASHGASGTTEPLSYPHIEVAEDEEFLDIHVGDVKEGDLVWFFYSGN